MAWTVSRSTWSRFDRADQARLGRGKRNQHPVVLVAETRPALGFQDTDHTERLAFDAHRFTHQPLRAPEQVVSHFGAE